MKNIFDIIAAIGLTIPEDKKAEFDKAVAENYKTIAEFDKLKVKHDNLDGQLTTAKESLKSFEGVDVADLKGQIIKLTGDLATKETDYQNKLYDMEFGSTLDGAISSAGARNAKAVKALLDVDALKTSKNRDGDIKSALETLKKENDYLFASGEPVLNSVAPTGTPGGSDPMSAIRSAMGLPAEKK